MSRRVKVSFETDRDRLDVIFGLLKGEIDNFAFTEVNGKRKVRLKGQTNWARKFLPTVQKYLNENNAYGTKYNDPNLIKVLVEAGCSPGSAKSVLSALATEGKLIRHSPGHYCTELPPKK